VRLLLPVGRPSGGGEARLRPAETPITRDRLKGGTGSFSINGPRLPGISFTAPTGTTGAQLASRFANELNCVAGHSAHVQGDDLLFKAPAVGTVAFSVDGSGIEYALSSVPEPSTRSLLGTGTALVALVRRLRRL
jgi:hypothetical protein